MYPFRRETLQTIALNVATDTNQRKTSQLSQNSFTFLVYLVLRVTVAITVATATSIKFPGSAAQAFDFVGINENGFDRVLIDPRVGIFIGQMRALSGLTSTRMTTNVVGTYNLVETIPIFFSNPNSLDPGETAFRERNPTAPTIAFVQLSAAAAANIAIAGPATVAVTAASVDVIQIHNPSQKSLPYFVPFISQQLVNVNGANAAQRISLMTDRYCAAVIFACESSNGWQSDVINNIRLLSDVRQYIGPQMIPWEDFGRMGEIFFGGLVFQPNPAGIFSGAAAQTKPTVAAFDFVHHGQLSTMVEPNETNLRAEVDCQPSGTGANTIIRVTTIEMVRDLATYTGAGGAPRLICDPSPLPWTKAVAA